MAATLADLLPNWYENWRQFARDRIVLNRSKEGDVNSHLREIAQKALQQRTVPVEMLLEVSASAIRPSQVEYKHHNQLETLPAATIIWTAGNTVHPLIKDLPISQKIAIARSGSG